MVIIPDDGERLSVSPSDGERAGEGQGIGQGMGQGRAGQGSVPTNSHR